MAEPRRRNGGIILDHFDRSPARPRRTNGHTSHPQRSSTSGPAGRHAAPIPDPRPSALSPATVKRRLVIADLATTLVGFGVAFAVQTLWSDTSAAQLLSLLLAFASLPFWLAAGAANSLFTARANARPVDEFKNIVATALFGIASIVGLAFTFGFEDLSRGWIASVFVCTVLALAVERRIARRVFRRLRTSGAMVRPILVVGDDENAAEFVRTVQRRPDLGYRAVGFLTEHADDPGRLADLPRLGDISQVEAIAAEVGATGVAISLHSKDGPVVNSLSRRLTDAGLHVTLCSSLRDIDITRLRMQELDGRAMVYIEPTIRTGWRRVAARAFSLTVAAIGLILTAPLVATAAIAIKLDSPGPVLFRQRRIGQNGKPFEILKLRTMCNGADALKATLLDQNELDGPMFKMREDPRITKVGKFLRQFSIDELPQFWNVVRGEMSVVGPRPALPSEVSEWDADVHERLRVLPGVTGLWQVSGRSSTSFDEYKRLDLFYVDNWTLEHDLRIVARTIGTVLFGRGAS